MFKSLFPWWVVVDAEDAILHADDDIELSDHPSLYKVGYTSWDYKRSMPAIAVFADRDLVEPFLGRHIDVTAEHDDTEWVPVPVRSREGLADILRSASPIRYPADLSTTYLVAIDYTWKTERIRLWNLKDATAMLAGGKDPGLPNDYWSG